MAAVPVPAWVAASPMLVPREVALLVAPTAAAQFAVSMAARSAELAATTMAESAEHAASKRAWEPAVEKHPRVAEQRLLRRSHFRLPNPWAQLLAERAEESYTEPPALHE